MIKRNAFTLIELLIVVAIIAILAALAAVNFSEAQGRSKVARAHADMRTLATALEAYNADCGHYPMAAIGDVILDQPLVVLTRPTAYLTSVPQDAFGIATFDFAPALQMVGYNYKDRATTSIGMPGETYAHVWNEPGLGKYGYFLHSCGPNKVWDVTPFVDYDASNGTVSRGDIIRFGPK